MIAEAVLLYTAIHIGNNLADVLPRYRVGVVDAPNEAYQARDRLLQDIVPQLRDVRRDSPMLS